MGFNIVLVEPEIPTNTGNIGRLSLASGSVLHLVKPFGFELNDKRLKRAGLDYWKHISINIYENIEDFYLKNKEANMVYFSSSVKLKSNVLTIQVPSQFFYEWLEEHYVDLLKKIIRKEIGSSRDR